MFEENEDSNLIGIFINLLSKVNWRCYSPWKIVEYNSTKCWLHGKLVHFVISHWYIGFFETAALLY